jgi:integrase/recombinase XerD
VEYVAEATDFTSAIETFLLHCRIKNLSKFTVKYYVNTLKELVKFLEIVGVARPIDMTEAKINECILAKLDSGVLDSTVNTNLKGWRTFIRFLHEKSYITTNPVQNVVLLKTTRHIIPSFSKTQIKQLFAAPDKSMFTGFRDYVIMMLMIETGARVSEVESLQTTDANFSEGKLKVMGKGRKERYVPFQATLAKELKRYMNMRGLLGHGSLFVNIDNTPLKKRTIQENIQTYGLVARLDGVRCSPHTFRHTFAKLYIMNGGDAFSLQQMLGHTTVEMVQTYVSLFGADISRQHRKFSPLENLNEDA